MAASQASALGWSCDTIDSVIADELKAAQDDFKKAAKLAKSIEGKGTVAALTEVAGLLNPLPSVPTAQSLAEDGFFAACTSAVGSTIARGLGATKTALEISMAIGTNTTSGIQGSIDSLRKTGHEHIQNASDALKWKKENCPPEENECKVDAPVEDIDVLEEQDDDEQSGESIDSGETGGSDQRESRDGGVADGQTFSRGGVTVTILSKDSARIETSCSADDKRIQMRTTGTWSTKTQGENSTVVENLHPGTRYEVRDRCDRENGQAFEFVFPSVSTK